MGLLTLGAPHAGASSDQSWRSETGELRGTNIIQGSQTSMMRVHIPTDATVAQTVRIFREGPSSSVSVNGKGRVIGVILIRESPDGSVDVGSDYFMSGRMGECEEIACDPDGAVVNFQTPFRFRGGEGPHRHTIAAGDYRLYLLADGSPVTVRLKLEGLQGTQLLTPKVAAPFDLKTPTQHIAQFGGPSHVAAGDTFEAGRIGIVVSMMSVYGPKTPIPSAYGVCGYRGASTYMPPPQAAFGAHCFATGLGGFISGYQDAGRFTFTWMHRYGESAFPPYDGTMGQGVWLTTPNPVDSFASQTFLLSLD